MRSPSPAGKTLTDLILEVFQLNARLLATGDRLARRVGQTSARWQVLGATHSAPRTVPQIAHAIGLTRQSVQRTTNRLEAEGLVTYQDNPAHTRAKFVALTPQGRSVLNWITRRQVVWADYVGARFGEPNIQRALRIIREFRAVLEHSDRRVAEKQSREHSRYPMSSRRTDRRE